MEPTPIYTPKPGQRMRVAVFMSGSGTNARKIIEASKQPGSSYRVALVFTDVKETARDKEGGKTCKALEIAREHGLPYECVDILDFYRERGHKSKKDLSLRPDFDKLVLERVEPYKPDLIVLAGYMSITTQPFLDRYNGRIINVHPADLSITEGVERKYTGMHTVRDAILAGEKEIRATTHLVREKVDGGEILVISHPVAVTLPEGATPDSLRADKELQAKTVAEHQDRLKREGDWVIFPLTIQMIGEGKFSVNDGLTYVDGKPAPRGFRLES